LQVRRFLDNDSVSDPTFKLATIEFLSAPADYNQHARPSDSRLGKGEVTPLQESLALDLHAKLSRQKKAALDNEARKKAAREEQQQRRRLVQMLGSDGARAAIAEARRGGQSEFEADKELIFARNGTNKEHQSLDRSEDSDGVLSGCDDLDAGHAEAQLEHERSVLKNKDFEGKMVYAISMAKGKRAVNTANLLAGTTNVENAIVPEEDRDKNCWPTVSELQQKGFGALVQQYLDRYPNLDISDISQKFSDPAPTSVYSDGTSPEAEPLVNPVPDPAQVFVVGQNVLVPQSVWPDYECNEHEGKGWEATIVSIKKKWAKIKFPGVDARGRVLAEEELLLSLLRPL